MNKNDNNTNSDSSIYHAVSPTLVLTMKINGAMTITILLISIILSIIRGLTASNSYYLVTTNLSISLLLCLILIWWYKSGVLPDDKLWFFFIVFGAIILQCITSDIYLFADTSQHPIPTPVPTVLPPPVRNLTTIPWTTVIKS